jgi:hypothetical protein
MNKERKVVMINQNNPIPKSKTEGFIDHLNAPESKSERRPPLPPFTLETAIQKVRMAEDGWNSRDPQKVALAYTPDSRWRNRSEFVNGRQEIVAFLTRKWERNWTTG